MNYEAVKIFVLQKLDKELSTKLFYHGKRHTLDVLEVAEELCALEQVSDEDTLLVKTAALFHDLGFTLSYENHEEWGCKIVHQHLKDFAYNPEQIAQICAMIMATKIPQSPKTLLEKILCDADLDYLGRADFYEIGGTLFQELEAHDILNDEQKWNRIQVSFLQSHHYHTTTNQTRRRPIKQKYLEELQALVATY